MVTSFKIKASTFMEDIQLDGSNGNIKSSQKQFLDPKPVPSGSSGVGLPYAPEDWPHPGDKWFWKVGSRKYASGHFIDRFIRPPKHLPRASGSSRPWIHSKLSLKQYLQKEFPQTDVNAIFDSFIWKIPAESTIKVKLGHIRPCRESLEPNKCLGSEILEVNKCPAPEVAINVGGCKAGNKMCIRMRNLDYRSEHKACDICCTKLVFCLDCCCILCCTTVDSVHQSYNFIRCQAVQEGSFTCGHVAHLDCALRAYMAGTVGGSIDLDAEYYCRCCDKKTDLIPHVAKIIETSESLGSRDDVEKMLTLGFCILHGSEKMRANNLRDRIGAVMVKLNCGVSLGEIWKVENDISTISAGQANSITMSSPPTNGRNHTVVSSTIEVEHASSLSHMPHVERKETLYITSNHIDKSAKLEDDVDQALRGLKRSQESEYRTAEEKLYGQKDLLLGLYQQLEVERAELARPMPSAEGSRGDALLTSVLARVDQIKREEMKLKQMMRIAEGFGLAPRTLLKEYYGMSLDD
ncbi:hypothetical protein HPP92_009392 [Vanilla planifolia]|uniref:Oberon PHD finger domain-containing protein n=1 Tax=Vanilla planifolia TaxID=51239 RepID=A0A835V6K8_VANPL|nr:hypothetical protein HPP92_009392 [Vanilla planifolia]